MKSYEKGKLFEDKAVEILKKAGYRILDRNFRTRQGEIDIIAEDGDTLVFVEVRYRKNGNFGSPEETVNRQKVKKLVSTAYRYISMKNLNKAGIRFDLIAIEGGQIRHLKNVIEDIF
ncbi:MAG: YraN family protein [Aquificae bacterium]|nr:YraN family protein [Aquificota bacterium]